MRRQLAKRAALPPMGGLQGEKWEGQRREGGRGGA